MSDRISELHAQAASYFQAATWSEAARHFDDLARLGALAAHERAPYLVSLANAGRTWDALALADAKWVGSERDRRLVRRLAIAPAIEAQRLDEAEAILELLVQAHPESFLDRSTLASVLMRNGDREQARVHLQEAARLKPNDPKVVAKLILGLLQARDYESAAALARLNAERCTDNARLCELTLLALVRVSDNESALRIIERYPPAPKRSVRMSELAASILLESGDPERALAEAEVGLGKRATAKLHSLAARAALALSLPDETIEVHIQHAATLAPRDVSVLEMLAVFLLRTGRFQEAVAVTSHALSVAPDMPNLHALHGRALKHAGQYEHAADAMLKVLSLKPKAESWRRQATAALSQAGRRDEAEALHRQSLEDRRARLGASFGASLEALTGRVDTVEISPARLNWAWKIATEVDGAPPSGDRTAWERSARWGVLADQLVLDWIECRPDGLAEIGNWITGVDVIRTKLSVALERRRGVIIAAAHLGPLFAGILAVKMTGLPLKVLASAASLPSVSYYPELVSTSDQNDLSIVRAIHRALADNDVVIIAIDGATGPSAPRVPWQGHQVTYSNIAARVAYHSKVPTMFGAPYWDDDGRIGFVLDPMPAAEPAENELAFTERWRTAYFDEVRDFFRRDGRDLRFSGGLWRNIGSMRGVI